MADFRLLRNAHDCYGTLIQWDQGLVGAVEKILTKKAGASVTADRLVQLYDHYEHALEGDMQHASFRDVAGSALALAMQELGPTASTGFPSSSSNLAGKSHPEGLEGTRASVRSDRFGLNAVLASGRVGVTSSVLVDAWGTRRRVRTPMRRPANTAL